MPWATVHHGLIGDLRIQPRHPAYNSLQQAHRMGYEMRPIARQPDAQRRPLGSRPFPDQNRGFRPQPRTGRDYSRIKSSSTCNLIIGHNVTETIIRETLRRPGPHPHRSIRTSLDPLVIFMHHIDSNR